MNNLITSGLSYALMAAESNAKVATKPMNMVSRELKKQNPDMELVERASKYGMQELSKANEKVEKAQEELLEAQKIEKQEEKIEQEEKLNGKEIGTREEDTSNKNDIESTSYSEYRFDKLEINTEKPIDTQLKLESKERFSSALVQHTIQKEEKIDVRI